MGDKGYAIIGERRYAKMTLQERMIQYRAKHDISQRELAEKVGVSVQTINSVENGTQTPAKVTQAKIELVVGKDE